MIVNITQAAARWVELVERAVAGEEVIIARRRKPVIRLTPIEPSALNTEGSGPAKPR